VHAGVPDPLRLGVVPAGEQLLAADAAQHPQPADDVDGVSAQLRLLVAQPRLPVVQRPQQRGDRPDHDRYAGQDHQPELPRRREHDGGHHADRDDGADAARAEVQRAADLQHVGHPHAQDLAGRRLPRQRRAEPGRLPRDQLQRPVPRAERVGQRAPVLQDRGGGLHDAQREHHAGPEQQVAAVAPGEPVVDGAADGVRHQRLRRRPEAAVEGAQQDHTQLGAGEPEQVVAGGEAARLTGIRIGEAPHKTPDPIRAGTRRQRGFRRTHP
jgi:hypothetical protein